MSTRDELIEDLSREEHAPMSDHDPRDGSCRSCPWPIYMLGPSDIADALIAEGWRKKPTQEELREAIGPARRRIWLDPEDIDEMVADVLALMDRGQ